MQSIDILLKQKDNNSSIEKVEFKKTLECHPSKKRTIRELLKGHIPLGCPLMNLKKTISFSNKEHEKEGVKMKSC